ncbi:MAG: hypothetical protein M0R05_05495, partial [Bacilli bacterium]|nr:hypothetical protein [Bacilli bacterium]
MGRIIKKLRFLIIFVLLFSFSHLTLFVKAADANQVTIKISHQLESGIQGPTATEYQFGDTISINKLEGKSFLYYVVNGKLRLDLDDAFTFKAYSNYDIKLIYGSETNQHTINFMDTNLDHLSTVYVEDNGDPIEPIAPTKPKSVFIGWVLVEDYDKEVLPVEDVTEVNKDSVFVAKYELDEIAKTTTYNVSINGTSTSYKINEVVTSTAGAAPEGKVFSHWEDENGNVLSSNPTYKFTVLADITINAVFNDAKEYN